MIRFEHVTKRLGGRAILDDLSLEVNAGETLVILGPSGAGKSVTLKHIVGLMAPDSGSIYIGDDSITAAQGKDLERIRDRMGLLFQGGALLAWLNVGENVALPLREKTKMGNDEILSVVNEKLRLVGLEKDFHKMPSEISGGMRKRVSLARAIVNQPEVVLYDEPTSGLEPVTSRKIDDLIENTRETLGVTSVVVTHDLHSALSIGTRVAMLYNGRIIALASPKELMESDQAQVREFLDAQYITTPGPWERDRA